MKPVQDQFCDPSPGNKQRSIPVQISRLAVVCSETSDAPAGWPSNTSAELIATLVREEQIAFAYFPVRYIGVGAAESVDHAFDQIDAEGPNAFDAILVTGEASGEADIGMVHQVLAPRIAKALAPVLTCLGPDDSETILGDTACKVFPTVDALAEFLVARVQGRYAQGDEALARIRSLGQFHLAEHEVESKILLQAVLQPTLQRHLESLAAQTEQTRQRMHHAAQQVRSYLLREEAVLEQFRSRIDVEIARIGKNNAASAYTAIDGIANLPATSTTNAQHLKTRIGRLQIILLVAYLCLLAIAWRWTTPSNVIFVGGAMLVIFSALYVAICNRLSDGTGPPYDEPDEPADERYDELALEAHAHKAQTTSATAEVAKPGNHSAFDGATTASSNASRRQPSARIEPRLK